MEILKKMNFTQREIEELINFSINVGLNIGRSSVYSKESEYDLEKIGFKRAFEDLPTILKLFLERGE